MEQRTFEERLFPWLDGELAEEESAAMEAHCAANADARARAEAERAFNDRMRHALLAGVDGRSVVMSALKKTEPKAAVFRLRPKMVAVAASLFAAWGTLWFLCVPPFECPFVSAMEEAASERAVHVPTGHVIDTRRLRAAVGSLGTIEGEQTTELAYGEKLTLREDVRTPEGLVTALSFHSPDDVPSCRRKREIDGDIWWVGFEGGKTIVCVQEKGHPERFLALVGPQPEETLIGFARTLRDELAR